MPYGKLKRTDSAILHMFGAISLSLPTPSKHLYLFRDLNNYNFGNIFA